MLERILKFSIQHRCLVVMLAPSPPASACGRCNALPIDAVPDITNNQVQINTLFAALSPVEVEKQVTFPDRDGAGGHSRAAVRRARSRATASRR